MNSKPTITVITATFNAEDWLQRLIDSLLAQTDQDFEWVVADGGSQDSTLKILRQTGRKFRKMVVHSAPDFGIYDAINRALNLASSEYYLVLGADDSLTPQAIENYKIAVQRTGADLVSAGIWAQSRLISVNSNQPEWLYGQRAYVAGHAVGLLIRRSLHDRIGYYEKTLPIAADQLFILRAIHGGARLQQEGWVAGTFGSTGVSTRDSVGTMTEFYRAQLLVGHNYLIQTLLLVYRLARLMFRRPTSASTHAARDA